MKKEINIGKHIIGFEHPVYFIADIAANHDGDIERAKDLIWKVADNGGQAVKFQNFFAETIVSDYGFKSLSGQKSHQSKWKKSIFEVYQDASLPLEWATVLRETANEAGVDYLTAPYDLNLIRKLDEYVCAWKLGSGDITWHEEIELLAKSGKPLLIATGATSMQEVRYAVKVALNHTDNLVLMQCNTNYTASIENFHYISLNVLKKYAYEWPNVILGLSDHTPGNVTVLGAVALGARVIEKHFTDNVCRDGPDHKFSMDEQSWKEMILRTRELEAALGTEEKKVMQNEQETVILQRRSVRTNRLITKGEIIHNDDLSVLRPCPQDAIPPYRINEVLGKSINRNIDKGDYIRINDLE
ncbi:N-acetylneuraminate synthase [bacterium]|jgi:sialic acid synthase SpsE|nr:N-acetylneuraminate synthase [bacterium]